jgi:hypothetical protein
MTLSLYTGTALRLDPQSHKLDATYAFGAPADTASTWRQAKQSYLTDL